MKNIYSLILVLLLITGVYAQFANTNQVNANSPVSTYAGYDTGGYSKGFYGDAYSGGTNTMQSNQPNTGGFSSSQYWPQMGGTVGTASENCEGKQTDFLVTIPPGACTPNVVRSDLLAEQSVPVFCKVSALRINPLIDASAIQSISFSGEYSDGVSGVSYHPARQAVRSYKTLLGGPFVDNAGYVVVTLSRHPDERTLPKWVEGNLTANIRYDAKHVFGLGNAEYYLEAGKEQVPFWNGKGFLEVESVENGMSRINLYSRRDQAPYRTFTLREGQESPLVYFPGYYCSAGFQVKLNRIVAPENMALLNIEGDQIWVRKGSKFLDNKCSVKQVDVFSGGSGNLKVTCAGKSFDLKVGGRGAILNNGEDSREYNLGDKINSSGKIYYLAYSGEDPEDNGFAMLVNREIEDLDLAFINNHFADKDWSKYTKEEFRASIANDKEGKSRIGQLLTGDEDKRVKGYTFLYQDIQEDSMKFNGLTVDNEDQDKYGVGYELQKGKEVVEDLVDLYTTEEKFEGTYWGEEALFQQILLSGQSGYIKTQIELIDLFQEKYPSSDLLEIVLEKKRKNSINDYSKAHSSIQVNNEFFNVFVESFRAEKDLDKSATIKIGGRSAEFVREGDEITFDDGNITIEEIKVNGIFFRHTPKEKGKSTARFIGLDNYGIVGAREVEVRGVEVREVAYVSIIPDIRKTRSQADFSFKIGIEKRNIQLNPDKTREAIEGLNQTIAMWENLLDKLGKVIKVWKATCFATSTILMLETMLSGFDGESLARSKVMGQYKTLCDIEIGKGVYKSRTECYNAISGRIDGDVARMTQAINGVNNQLDVVQQGNVQTQGLIGKESILNQTRYVEDLKGQLKWQGVEIDGVKLETNDLSKSTEISKVMLYQNLGCTTQDKDCLNNPAADVACCAAWEEMKGQLKSAAIRKQANIEGERISKEVGQIVGGDGIPRILTINSKNVRTLTWGGETGDSFQKIPVEIKKTDKIQFLNLNGETYLIQLKDSTLGGTMGINKAFILKGENWEPVKDLTQDGLDKFVFMGGSKEACSGNIIKNPEVRFYESGRNKGLPAIVPFDVPNGWYVYVPNSQGSMLEGTQKTYTAAGDVNFLWICNVGQNGVIEQKSGDDLCQSFSVNQMGFDTFISCGMEGREVGQLYAKARDAITQAAAAYGRQGYVDILGQNMKAGAPLSDNGGTECQDFMSPEDCKMLFNACDPVICPSSRCDLGGKYPVSDVVQTGIVGSVALCLPNAREGIIFPVCLTGIHAGIDAFVSILKSEKDCMQHNLDTGEYVGICDEITAIYMCEFFWRNFGSLFDVLLPSFFENTFGKPSTRGGGEYLTVQSAWDNMGKSMDFFTGFYAENAITAFQLRGSENIGTEVCNGFLGTSIPGGLSAEGFDALLAPESPTQFYAYFSEVPFTDATSPATSHYKVYYHIFAGNDFGASYRVYLRNPPVSGYYATMSSANVKTGYVARGQSADEAIDFTAPAGYKELCVRINNEEHCGFQTVSSSFAVNYATEKYAEDQATQTDITSEEECTSTSSSAWGLVSPNIQAGAETAVGGRDINLAGITRVCASSNPAIGIASEKNTVVCTNNNDCGTGYSCQKVEGSEVGNCVSQNGDPQQSAGRWVDVGYCGDPNLRCWLDSSTLKDRFKAIDAVNQEIYGEEGTVVDHIKYGEMFDSLQQSYEHARALLSEEYNRIIQLTPAELRNGESGSKVSSILQQLDLIIGVYTAGEGTSNNKAEALALKATIYRMIVEQKMRDNVDGVFRGATLVPSNTESPAFNTESSSTIPPSQNHEELDTSLAGPDVYSQPTESSAQSTKFSVDSQNNINYDGEETGFKLVTFSSGNMIIQQGGGGQVGSVNQATGEIIIDGKNFGLGFSGGNGQLVSLNRLYYSNGDIIIK